MDVSRSAEPPSTARVRGLVDRARARLIPSQLAALDEWALEAPYDNVIIAGIRRGEVGLEALGRYARSAARDRGPAVRFDPRVVEIPRALALAETRPAVASSLVWQWLGATHPAVAGSVVCVLRERAGLPGLRGKLDAGEITGDPIEWFADRQLVDVARWMEHVPAPEAATFAATVVATEAQREAADRLEVRALVPFLQRAAAFLAHVAAAGVDPLGFALAGDAELDVDPPRDRRLELATWARRAGHALCVRGRMIVLRIGVNAPWPLALELVASELGRGVCGGGGLLLRLHGELAAVPLPTAPLLLLLPGEPVEELGPRFERWLAVAYPRAVDAWRPWT